MKLALLFIAIFSFSSAYARMIDTMVCRGSSENKSYIQVHDDHLNGPKLSYAENTHSPTITFETTATPDLDDPLVGTWTGVKGDQVGVLTVHWKKSEPEDLIGTYTKISAGKPETFTVECEIPD